MTQYNSRVSTIEETCKTDIVREMDETTRFVHLFINNLEKQAKLYRSLVRKYVFDRRPGTIQENFDKDAKLFADYIQMFRPKGKYGA